MKTNKLFATLFLMLVFIIKITAQLPPYVPSNGLVGWWPFTGNANDLSANANNGTVTGAVLTTDRFNNANSAYSFDGMGDYINCGNAPSVNLISSITISAWVYATNLNNTRGIVSKAPLPTAYALFSEVPGTQIGFLGQYINFSVPTYTWVHVVSVFNSSTQQINLYINGVSVSSFNTGFNSLSTSGENLYLGAHRPLFTPQWSWFGKLDEMGIWNRALTLCEINQLYSASLATISIVTSNSLICAGQNATISASGANSYTWSNSSNLTSVVVSPSVTMAYSVAGTNSAGCTSTSAINLTVNPNPIITVNNGTICAGQNFTINPNGANTYTIQGGNAVVSPTSNASFTVAGTNAAGCVSQAFVISNLTVSPNPIITVNNGTICVGQNFTINPNGANTYTIQGGISVVSPVSNANYTVVGTSTAGCLSQAFATSSISVSPNPTITVNNGTICTGQNFSINPNGANTYTIQGGTSVVSPVSSANYTVVGTSTAGCLSQAFATSSLTVNPNPIIAVNNGTICAGENFTIIPNGANTYTIQGGNSVVSPSINTNYTVVGTSTFGCVSQAFATSSLTVNQCVGITNQNMGLGGVAIYPNPNNGEFIIKLVSLNNTYINITNVLGQIIKTHKAELINQINLNLFEKGIYFINIMDNNQSVYKGSIIKE